jgi:hypothetical protein
MLSSVSSGTKDGFDMLDVAVEGCAHTMAVMSLEHPLGLVAEQVVACNVPFEALAGPTVSYPA